MPTEIPPQALVPFRWPASWTDPALLSRVKDGPINCIVAGPGLEQIADAAGRVGLVVRTPESLGARPLAGLDSNSPNPVVTVGDLGWPRLKPMAANRRDQAEAGPTGAPWIDSNSWVARLASARVPGKMVWLAFDPPPKEAPGEGAYRIAIADAAAAGARWIVSLDDQLGRAVAQGNADAVAAWRGILTTLSFFEKQRAWRAYTPHGPLGIISSFSGDNEFMGTELLNLAARRNLLYRIVERPHAGAGSLVGLRAVLWADKDGPTPELTSALSGFARQGGLVILPQAVSAVFKGERPIPCAVAGYDMSALGQGCIAAATRDWDDPFFVAADAHNLVGRRYDPIRLFSGAACWVHYSVAPTGKDALFQFVNFSWSRALGGMMGTGEISFRLAAPHRSVTLHTIGAAPVALKPVKYGKNEEYLLPQFGAYAGLEVKA